MSHLYKNFEGKDSLEIEELKADHALKCKMNRSWHGEDRKPDSPEFCVQLRQHHRRGTRHNHSREKVVLVPPE